MMITVNNINVNIIISAALSPWQFIIDPVTNATIIAHVLTHYYNYQHVLIYSCVLDCRGIHAATTSKNVAIQSLLSVLFFLVVHTHISLWLYLTW